MKRKEVLIAVIAGCFGAVITMGVGLFIPVGVIAQSQPTDVAFGKIQCREIEVVDSSGKGIVSIGEWGHGGCVYVFSKGGVASMRTSSDQGVEFIVYGAEGNDSKAMMSAGEHGAAVTVVSKEGYVGGFATMGTKEDGSGIVTVWGKGGTASMDIDEHGGHVSVQNKERKESAVVGIDEHGGRIDVFNKQGKIRVGMGVNEYGNGAVSTWDRNGYRQ